MTNRLAETPSPRAGAPIAPAVGARSRARQLRELRGRIGRQITEFRTDAGATVADLARCAAIDPAHLWRIEAGTANASLETLLSVAGCLGSDLGVRMFPTAGPRIHDRFQAPMLEAIIKRLGPEWRGQPRCLFRPHAG